MSLDVIADGDGDRISHCSADSSVEANGEEHTLFSHSLIVGDKNGSQCSTGKAGQIRHVHTHALKQLNKQLVCMLYTLVLVFSKSLRKNIYFVLYHLILLHAVSCIIFYLISCCNLSYHKNYPFTANKNYNNLV